MIEKLFFLVVLHLCLYKTLFACNGYSLTLNYARNCIENSIYKLHNLGMVLDKDCNIYQTGCIEVTKPFKTAKGSYHIKKSPMPPMDGEIDFCETIAQYSSEPMLDKFSELYGMPKACPVTKAQKVCGGPDKKINIGKYKNQLGLASGTTEIKLEVTHDTGKTCVEISSTLKKGKKS